MPSSQSQPLLDHWLTRFSSRTIMALVLAGIVAIGIPDYYVGIEISLFIFYIFPVAIATWYIGRRAGYVAGFLSAIPSLIERLSQNYLSQRPAIMLWNVFLHIGTMLIFVNVFSRLVSHIRSEREFARIDLTTGLLNRRAFIEHLDYSVALLRREDIVFSVAYIDLDDFKAINDRHGHDEGDRVLRLIAGSLMHAARQNDIVARLGGDEFAMLICGANREQALLVLEKARLGLREALEREHRRVTCSIGCVAVQSVEPVENIINAADQLMYRIKHGGKDGIFVEELSALSDAGSSHLASRE